MSSSIILPPMQGSRMPPPLWRLIVAAVMWALNRFWPMLTIIPAHWSRFGLRVITIASITPLIAIAQFRIAQTTINPHKPERTTALVTSGLYGWTRNPMYLALSILLFGWAVELGTLTPFAGPLLFIALIHQMQIRPEEHTLRIRFGEDYDRYCDRVNRWLGWRSR